MMMITLQQWAARQPYTLQPQGAAFVMPDSTRLVDRAEAWSLSDYRVSSVTGGSIWFVTRTPAPMDDGTRYRIVRFYFKASIRRRIITDGLTLSEAQEHCGRPDTSSSTCTSAAGKARTRRMGAWFDGYEVSR